MQTQWFPGQTYTNMDPLSTNYFTGGQMGYMPNAQYLTDPSYGAFRTPMPMQQHPTNYSYPGLFQSLMTSWRGNDTNKVLRYIGETFAHSPMGANQLQYQAEAARRIQDAKSSAIGAGVDLGISSLFTAGGTALGALSPIPGGALIGGAIGGMIAPSIGGMMTERQRTARQLQLLTSPLITSGRDVNRATGQGLGLPAAGDLTSFLHKEAAGDYFFKLEDYKKFTSLAAKSGMFDYANSVDQFKSTIKKVRKDMMTLMDIFETADPEDVFKQLQRLQISGAGQSESLGIASKERLYSTMAGMGHQQMINSYGQSGALMYNQMGRTGYLGELANVANVANITMAKRLGLIKESELNRMGGVGGASERMTHEVHGKAFGDIMDYVGAYVWNGDMEGNVDKDKLDNIRAGNFDFYAVQKSMQGMSRDPRKLLQYNAVKDLLQHNIESGMGEDGVKEAVYNMALKLANTTNLRKEDDQFKALNGMQMLGVSAPMARQVMAQMGSSAFGSAFRENQEKEYEKRLASINKKFEEQEHLWAKMTVKFKEAFNMFEEMSLKGLSIRAKWLEDQRKENRANGKDTPIVFDDKGAGFIKNTPKEDQKAGAGRVLRKSPKGLKPREEEYTYEATPGGTSEMFDDWGYGTGEGVPAPHVPVDTNKPAWQQERYKKIPKTIEAQKYPDKFVYKGGKPYDGRYDAIISEMAKKYNVPENALKSILLRESNFDPDAVSPMNKNGTRDKGIAQINESNFDVLEKAGIPIKSKWNDPKVSIEAEAYLFSEHWRETGGDMSKSAAMYNGGPRMKNPSKWSPAVEDYSKDVTHSYNLLNQQNLQVPQKAKDYAQSGGATDKSGFTDWYNWSHSFRLWTPDIIKQMRDYTEYTDYSKIHSAANASAADRVRGRDEFNEELKKYGLSPEDVIKNIGSADDINEYSGDKYEKLITESLLRAHKSKNGGKSATAEEQKAYKDSASKLAGSQDVKGHILSHTLGGNEDLRKSYIGWGNKVKKAYYQVRNDKVEEINRETDKMMNDIAPGVYGATGNDLNSLVKNNVELLKAYQMFTVGSKMKSDIEFGNDTGELSSALHDIGNRYYKDFKFEADGSMDPEKFKAYLKKKGYSEEEIDAISKMAQAKKETLKSPGDIGKFTKQTGELYNRKVDEYYQSARMGLEDLMEHNGITSEMLESKDAMAAYVKKNPNNALANEVYSSMQNGAFDMDKFLMDNQDKLSAFTNRMAEPDELRLESQKARTEQINKQNTELIQTLHKVNQTVDKLNKTLENERLHKTQDTAKKVGNTSEVFSQPSSAAGKGIAGERKF